MRSSSFSRCRNWCGMCEILLAEKSNFSNGNLPISTDNSTHTWAILPPTCSSLNQSLLIISPVTRRAATRLLVRQLRFFISNNVRMSTATEMCTARCVQHDHNSNNCTHSRNVCCCTYMVNNDYDKFRSFSPSLYDFISASNLHIFAWKS